VPSSTRSERAWPPFCVPLFTSDGLNLYFYALTAHFGQYRATSLIATMREHWNLGKSLTARDGSARSFARVHSLSKPRAQEHWPEIDPRQPITGAQAIEISNEILGDLFPGLRDGTSPRL
jgi:hypothetical protein